MATVLAPETPAPSPTRAALNRPSRQGLCCVWHGLNWSGWNQVRKIAGPFPPENRWRRHSIAVQSLLNSWHEFWENVLFGRQIERTEITHPPLFVLGHWRSGTTLLHNLLALDPQITYPNLYQVLFAGHFLLTERIASPLTGWAIPKTRPMDNIPVGWDMSQEDEVALHLRTLCSPYMMLAYQGQREHYKRFFDLTELTDAELSLWKREFLRLLKKLTIRANRPIVLKSPSHTYRIPLLLEMFPNARFVYIHRDPYTVISSSMHLRRNMFTDNALGVPSFENLEEDTLVTYEECIRRYESTKSLIPAGQLHELRFEDLEADPLEELRKVYEGLSLPGWSLVAPRIEAELPKHQNYRKNRFSLDEDTRRRYYERLKFAFDLYGYDSREPASDAR